MRRGLFACLLALNLITASRACLAWGSEGHAIVAEIAERRLSPAASSMVRALLGPGVSLAAVASWADEVRSQRPDTARWHYVDIPKAALTYDPARDCTEHLDAHSKSSGDCVVNALTRAGQTLACATKSEERRDALRFAVHFVGDIHQPLHAVAEQQGGNLVPVRGEIHGATCDPSRGAPGASPICALGAYDSLNLHMLWDTTLIRRTTYSWGAYVDRLEAGWLKTEGFQARVNQEQPANWAIQSHLLAREIWNEALVPGDGALGETYYATVLPVLDQQLALAGIRLASFLNDVAYGLPCDPARIRPSPGAETGLTSFLNIGDAKQQLKAYITPPAGGGPSHYQRDQDAVAEQALAWLKVQAPQVRRPAITLDIDETALDNLPEMVANDYGYIVNGPCDLTRPHFACGVNAWNGEADGTENPPPPKPPQAKAVTATLRLYRAARALGIAVFFITGRHEDERSATTVALHAAGFEDFDGLLMEPVTPTRLTPQSAADFKAIERAKLLLRGYHVVLNMGDQPSDLAGGYADRAFLMPNPFYHLP